MKPFYEKLNMYDNLIYYLNFYIKPYVLTNNVFLKLYKCLLKIQNILMILLIINIR